MKIIFGLLALSIFASCSTVNTPNSGMLYTQATASNEVNFTKLQSNKQGEACTEGILGVVTGDSTVATAAKNGGITKVSHVDHKVKNVLGLYTQYCTVVYGQ